MKNLSTLFILLLCALGCTIEPDTFNYKVSVRNTSSHLLTIDAYSEGALLQQVDLDIDEVSLSCSYYAENFTGYQLAGCLIDSLRFTFDDGRGYLTSINHPTEYEFDENDGLFGPGNKFVDLENYTYEFVITEDDFNNAHDLPE